MFEVGAALGSRPVEVALEVVGGHMAGIPRPLKPSPS